MSRLIALFAIRDDLHSLRQSRRYFCETFADHVRVANRNLKKLLTGARRRADTRLKNQESDLQQQDWSRDAERVGDRITNGRIVVAKFLNRGLQRRRTRARASE